jgi:hypothetical protein
MSHVTSGWRFEPLKIVKILTKFGSIISCFPTAELDCDWRSKVSRWDDPRIDRSFSAAACRSDCVGSVSVQQYQYHYYYR